MSGCRLENIVDALTCERGAFEVLFRADAFAHVLAFIACEELFGAFAHFLLRHGVVAEILFEADQNYGDPRAALEDFGMPVGCVSAYGLWEWASRGEYHLVVMFCSESGLETEKAMRMT